MMRNLFGRLVNYVSLEIVVLRPVYQRDLVRLTASSVGSTTYQTAIAPQRPLPARWIKGRRNRIQRNGMGVRPVEHFPRPCRRQTGIVVSPTIVGTRPVNNVFAIGIVAHCKTPCERLYVLCIGLSTGVQFTRLRLRFGTGNVFYACHFNQIAQLGCIEHVGGLNRLLAPRIHVEHANGSDAVTVHLCSSSPRAQTHLQHSARYVVGHHALQRRQIDAWLGAQT